MTIDIRRREFIAALGGAAAVWPLAARAQQPAVPVIGRISAGSPATHAERTNMFRKGLAETGYVEGQNVAIDFRWAGEQFDRFPALAADLVHRQVSVIAVGGIPGTLAVKAATTTIPVVFYMGGDPVKLGIVGSLARPGGNITGVTTLGVELEPKRLELARELVPSATSSALLVNPATPNAAIITKDVQAAARTLGLELHVLHATTEHDLEAVFANFSKLRAGALVIGNDGVFINRAGEMGALSVRHAVPAIFQFREFASAGGVLSYGGSLTEQDRLSGIYVGRILKGENPADLPVQQETKVELIINLKTAKALGITVPLSLLGRADEVIE
jgi:putative ABC transport system substrate-binding protein